MTSLTTSEITAAANAALLEGGYRSVEKLPPGIIVPSGARFFEDPFGVVEVVVFDTWEALREGWPNAQAALVELMSRFLKSGDAKSWEGYLALFTPAPIPDKTQDNAEEIRYNTSRVRKLLATGDELRTVTDVERALLPLLPLAPHVARQMSQGDRVFDLLPEILRKRGVSGEISRALIDAFLTNQPLLERLHKVKS
jgi:hypothetical protein